MRGLLAGWVGPGAPSDSVRGMAGDVAWLGVGPGMCWAAAGGALSVAGPVGADVASGGSVGVAA